MIGISGVELGKLTLISDRQAPSSAGSRDFHLHFRFGF